MRDCFSLAGCPGNQSALTEPATEQFLFDEKALEGLQQGQASSAPMNRSPEDGAFMKEAFLTKASKVTHLPILIFPGFMSSGLEIRKSQSRKNWEGKRIWLNLGSLGLSALYFGSAQRRKEIDERSKETNKSNDDEQQEQQQQFSYKSSWLEHMRLNDSDLCTDPPGIQVRAISGLEGVDYLTPGTFTNLVSYVFGPVIEALKLSGGYTEGVNLEAAPYDWRLPPAALEERDQYFSRTLKQVENLYRSSHNTPVVLLGHSMGTKTAHYFLNFAIMKRGQAWVDKYIHTYLPVGAPHLGAPKSLRSIITGDKMGLDAFLNDEEALALGRSIGSGPWLFPQTLPPGAPSSVYVRPHGVLEITIDTPLDTTELVNKRTSMSKPNRYQLIVTYGNDTKESSNRKLCTPFVGTMSSSNPCDKVLFTEKFTFATLPDAGDAAKDGKLQIFLQEPGIAAAKKEKEKDPMCFCSLFCCLLKWITCCCILDYAYRLVRLILCGLMRSMVLSADAITGGVGGGANLAFSAGYVDIPPAVWDGKRVTRKIRLYHKDDYQKYEKFLCFFIWKKPRIANLQVQMRWIPSATEASLPSVLCSPVCQPSSSQPARTHPTLAISHANKKHVEYRPLTGQDILEREGLTGTLDFIRNVYDKDSDLGPRTVSASDPPPVKRIHAIYGINRMTEVGGIYKRANSCLVQSRLKNLYQLDVKASIENKKSGYKIQNGLLYETPQTRQAVADGTTVCGDGTVPYWSLQHCKTWKSPERQVTVVELDKAEHREILADARFHKELLKYCLIPKESV